MIVFEDLHWSSDSLLDLAEFVMQPRGDSAVLMIVLARPELLDRRPNWGGGRLNHLAIALEPLRETAIADLVRYMLDTDAPDVIKLLSDRSEGNRFYAGDLVRAYLEQGSLQRLPDSVQATVLALHVGGSGVLRRRYACCGQQKHRRDEYGETKPCHAAHKTLPR